MINPGRADPVVSNIGNYSLAIGAGRRRPIYCTKKQAHRPERLGCTVYLSARQPFDGRPFMPPMPAALKISVYEPGGHARQAFAEDNGRQVAE
jgi:hypothetical protein